MNKIALECRELLKINSINIDSEIDFDVNSKLHTLSFSYIIDTFMMASELSQVFFLKALEKATFLGSDGVESFFQSMGQLLLMTHLSQKIEL
jgi:hypothetical protein